MSKDKLSWNQLMMAGVVVDMSCSRWPARVSIKPSDLGIADSDEVERALALGCHRLIPREAFEGMNAAFNRAKRTIESNSLPFGMISSARFVPDARVKAMAEKLKEHREAFYKEVDAFIANYEAVQTEMLPVIKKALTEAAQPMAAVISSKDGSELSPAMTKEEVAARAFARVANEYPPADVVRARFALNWKVYAVSGARSTAVAVALQDEATDVKNAVAEMAKSLRDEVTTKLGDVLALIQKGGKLGTKSIEAATAVLDHVEAVNVLGDSVLEAQVARMRAALRGINTEERVSDATVKGLADIKSELEANIGQAVADAEAKLTAVGRRKVAA